MTDVARLDALRPLPPEQLYRQWVLTRNEGDLPDEWASQALQGWWLAAHPDARVCTLHSADGAAMGWVIDPLVQLGPDADRLPRDEVVLPVESGADAHSVERALYGRDEEDSATGDGIHGMWVAIVLRSSPGDSLQRVYVGPTHSVVFSPQHHVVATSHNLVPFLQRDVELTRAFDPLGKKSYFTFGLTAFAGLHRLLPNHYLDLTTFRPVRHWPRRPLEPLPRGEDGAAAIVEHSRRVIRLLTTEYPSLRVFLSAGNDSRAVLSLLKPFVHTEGIDICLSTVVGRDVGSRVDAQAARQLAVIAGLPHEVTRREPQGTDSVDVLPAFVRIGEAMAGKRLAAAERAAGSPSSDSRFSLGGTAGETGRAYFWKRGLPRDISVDVLVRCTRSPATSAVEHAAEQWLSGLPAGLRPAEILDLAYVEQRLGCWGSPSRYLFPGRASSASLMAEAFNVEMMLRLPEDYRASGRLQRDMVAYGWPELLEVPFNTASGWLRLRSRALRLRRGVRRRLGRLLAQVH